MFEAKMTVNVEVEATQTTGLKARAKLINLFRKKPCSELPVFVNNDKEFVVEYTKFDDPASLIIPYEKIKETFEASD